MERRECPRDKSWRLDPLGSSISKIFEGGCQLEIDERPSEHLKIVSPAAALLKLDNCINFIEEMIKSKRAS